MQFALQVSPVQLAGEREVDGFEKRGLSALVIADKDVQMLPMQLQLLYCVGSDSSEQALWRCT